jgi:hypothetical protein
MAERYEGPATLRFEDGNEVAATVRLRTERDEYLSSWNGSATAPGLIIGLRAMGAYGTKLVLPDGSEGDVHIAAAEMSGDHSGYILHLHGSGPAPYEHGFGRDSQT